MGGSDLGLLAQLPRLGVWEREHYFHMNGALLKIGYFLFSRFDLFFTPHLGYKSRGISL